MSVEAGDIFIEPKPPSEWTTAATKEELVEKMSNALAEKVPNAAPSVFRSR
jgi:cobalt-zinc-cadmium resistance protein CzcA